MSGSNPGGRPADASSGRGLLDRIVHTKRAEVAALPKTFNFDGLSAPRDFRAALRRPSGAGVRVIAECKKASPSMGLMRSEYRPGDLAKTYAELGASALSILTDREYFQGESSHIAEAKAAGLPILRKDFTISARQIEEARVLGADAVLLVVRLLEDEELRVLLRAAGALGMAALVEIHEPMELDSALAAGADIFGINHRDLDTLRMDLSLTERLAPRIRKERPDAIIVAESGVESREGRLRVEPFVDAILIGTAFMRSSHMPDTWREIFGP